MSFGMVKIVVKWLIVSIDKLIVLSRVTSFGS